ncbi:MAG: carboxypeptidase regulatory-like domain-containing protein [Candidatus Korobacteraceae bacterium]
MRKPFQWILILTFLLAFSSSVFAQNFGQITGIVTDSSGGVLVGATVTVTNTQTGAARTAETNNTGNYVFPNLLPGVYNLRVAMQGFRGEARNGIELQVQQTVRQDFPLQVGSVAETIEVTAAAPLINTEDAALGTVIENRRIVDMPLNGRNFLTLAELTPNVSASFADAGASAPRQGGDRSSQQISVAGGRREWNYFTLDGINNTDVNFNSYIFLPSIDALQEFKVQSGIYSAEYGRALGQVSASTKSGTNSYHGTAWEFIRNNKLDALPYQFGSVAPRSTPFKWNQFGFTLNGPVQIPKVFNGRDKLFFMVNYEGFRLRNQDQRLFNVPSLAMRSGDFSERTANIRDPLTGQPFPGRIIPTNRLNPISLQLLEFYPAPNQPGAGLVNNYLAVNQNFTNKDQFTTRIDFVESSQSSWYGRYSWTDEAVFSGGIKLNGATVTTRAHQAIIDNARTLTPTVVNELRLGYNKFFNHSGTQLNNLRDVTAEIGLPLPSPPPPEAWGTPSIGIAGFSGFGDDSNSPFINNNEGYQVTDNMSWIKGTHFLKFGTDLRLDRFNQDGNQFARGSVSFANNVATGYGFADFLLGNIGSWSYASGLAVARLRAFSQAYYINDTWKLRPNLTINMGLRYEYTPPWNDKANRQITAQIPTNPDCRVANPLCSLQNPVVADRSSHPVLVRKGSGGFYDDAKILYHPDIQVARDGRLGDRLIESDYQNFAPRLGISWSPTSKWVLRVGAGIFFVQDIGNIVFDMNRNLQGRLTVQSTATNLISTWQDPFNFGSGNPCNAPAGVLCVERPLVLTSLVKRRTPYVGQYEAGIQRQLSNTLGLEVSYLGSQGHRLQRWVNLANQPVPGITSIASRSPFPEFGLFQGASNVGHSNYHSLGAKLTRSYAAGLTVLSSYTFSKSIDNGSGIRPLGTDPLNPQDSHCLHCERGLSVHNQQHRFTTSVVYDVPFGPGRRFLSQGALGKVIGGWKLNSIVTLGSGFPLTVNAGEDTANIGNCCRPNRNYSVSTKLDEPTRFQWFNKAAYSRATNGTLGTAGRSEIIGPGIIGWDFSTLKDFHITEGKFVQFRFEAFNFMNHPNWGDPNNNFANAAFSTITTTRTQMRRLQFGLKVVF